MMNPFSPSSIQEINAAMRKENPFEGRSSVKEPEIWGSMCPDLLHLNAQATTAIWQAIEQVGNSRDPVKALTILAESGMGKSHVLSRVRHQLQAQGKGFFIYINAQQFTDTSLVRQQFLYAIVNSLKSLGSLGVMQWQELALFPLDQALAISHPEARGVPAKKLIKKLNEQTLAKNQVWVNQVTEILLKAQPDIDNPDVLRAIIWMLCNAQAPYARHWLAGRPLAKWKLDEVGLSDRSGENRESSAWEITVQLLQMMVQYLPVVIAFDRLESNDINEAVVKKEQVVASLIKRLSDNLRQMQYPYGVVFVSAMTPSTWYEKMAPFLGKFSSYLSYSLEPIALSALDVNLLQEVVAQWLAEFYVERDLIPPTPVYPFEASQFPALMRENLTLQELIAWCEYNFQPVEIDPIEKAERLVQQFIDLQTHDSLYQEDQVAEALYFGFKLLVGSTIAQFKIEAVSSSLTANFNQSNYIQIKIYGVQNNQDTTLGISISNSSHGTAVKALFKRLVSQEGCDLTRTCLIRSYEKKISPHWKAYENFLTWQTQLQGRWIDMNDRAIGPFLALYELYCQRHQHQLTEDQIFEFIARSEILQNNPIILAILQAPPDENSDLTCDLEASHFPILSTTIDSNSCDPFWESPACSSLQPDDL